MAGAIFTVIVCYLAAGAAVGVAFVLGGVTRVQPAPVTAGARILLLPGSIIFWPLIVVRWIKGGRR